MARKPAPTKAHGTKKPTPTATKAIEPKPDRFSNPLLTDPAIHADLKPLFDAVVMVSVWSSAIARCYPDLLALKESRGLPKSEEWPDSPALERNRAQHAEWVKATREEYAAKGESVAVADFLEPRWTELMREWSGYYRDWCAAIATAKQAAKSPAVAALMDAGEARPAHRWTTRTIIDLDNLAGTLHPINVGGVDGLGFIRCGLPPLPQDFRTHAEAVGNRIGELRSIPVSAVPPTPTVSVSPDLLDRLQRAAAAVDPGAIDRAAERAAEKMARVFGAGDNGDAKPKTLPAGAEAIDEHDAALLAFLNRNPSLRRRVSDVLPEKGPQDRKAVAKRLRKLADRTPPLVDYPKDGRSGVVILPAGAEALKRATAPTPR